MNNELTNVYLIIKREFNDLLKHFNLENNKELASFLHYNAHNEMFTGTDDEYYHNANFKNLDTGRKSRIFTEGYIYFFPKDNDLISPNNEMTAFSIGKGTKCIKVNKNGIFIEKNDLKGNIVTQYYDMAALNEITKQGLSAGNIDYIEDYIQRTGISPDKIISATKNDDNLIISITENGEIIKQDQIQINENRTSYSIYFEYMKANNYYEINQIEQSNLHR